jgi:hypothetical protein
MLLMYQRITGNITSVAALRDGTAQSQQLKELRWRSEQALTSRDEPE